MAWVRKSPGLSRAFVLGLGLAFIALAAPRYNWTMHWLIAVLYGVTLALAMRWPLILPVTGARIVIVTGLLFEAAWHHGLATGVAMLLVEFGCRMVLLNRGRYYWEWHRLFFVVGSLMFSYYFAAWVSGEWLIGSHTRFSLLDSGAVIFSYVYWTLMIISWAMMKASLRARKLLEEIFVNFQQSWWVPLTFLAVGMPIGLLHDHSWPLDLPFAILLLWAQSLVGPIFTMLNQDRAIADLVRSSPVRSSAQRARSQRVLWLAHALATALKLSPHEIRQIGYAAVLQEDPEIEFAPPQWLAEAPTPEQREMLRHYLESTRRRVERNGALQEAGNLLRHRYAAYDGRGFPAVGGEAIPLGSEVLAAANAIASRLDGGDEPDRTEIARAVAWISANAADRFRPAVLEAMTSAFFTPETNGDALLGLPEAVRQLQGLVAGPSRPATLSMGLRRFWAQVRGDTRLAPDLPPEVKAVGRMAAIFASSTDSAHTAQIVVEAVAQLIGAKVALAVSEGSEVDLVMRVQAAHGFHQLSPVGRLLTIQGGQMARAILDRTPLQMADVRESNKPFATELAWMEGIRSVLFVPLVSRGRTNGLLMVCMQSYHWFTPREVGLIHLMAGQAAAAMENARLLAEGAERLERLASMKALTDTLLDNLNQAILVADPEGILVLANQAARERFGSELTLEVGQPIPKVLARACRLEGALAGEHQPEEDLPWGNLTLEVQAIPMRDGHGILRGAICLARDVTQARLMEQQIRRVEQLAAVGELAAGAAHEIRNPLTSIRGFIQLLQPRTAPEQAEYFPIILSEIDRVDAIIHDMLLLAKPAQVQPRPVCLPTLLEEVLLGHRAEFERQSIRVERAFDPNVGMLQLDPKMIRQLVLNLVINAGQAMPSGGTLRLGLMVAAPDHVALEIADTGVGISPENLKRLFVPFFTTKDDGTGLGLALCYSIIQAHHGRVDVESQVGVGTKITVTLPVRWAEAGE